MAELDGGLVEDPCPTSELTGPVWLVGSRVQPDRMTDRVVGQWRNQKLNSRGTQKKLNKIKDTKYIIKLSMTSSKFMKTLHNNFIINAIKNFFLNIDN